MRNAELTDPPAMTEPLAHILIADDQAENLFVLEAILGDDYILHTVGDGQELLDFLTSGGRADLILLDVMMPRMNGYEALDRLQADAATRDIPVIFLTVMDSPADEEQGLKRGAVDYVAKPVRPAILSARVKSHLGLALARRQLRQRNEDLERLVAARTAELVQANADLRASFDEIDDLYRNAPCGYHSVDGDGTFVQINDTELRMLGYSRDEIVGKRKVQDLMTPASRMRFQENFPRFLATGAIRDVEVEFRRRDGTTLPVLVSATAVTDAQGRHLRSRSVILDITERKRADEALRRHNRALRLLSECNMTLLHADIELILLESICRLIVEVGGYRMAWVAFPVLDAAQTVRIVNCFSHIEGRLDAADISWGDNERGQGPTGMAIRLGRVQINQNLRNNPSRAPWLERALASGYQANVALPLSGKGGVFGALTVWAAEPQAFGADEVKLLEKLAGDLAFGIESLRTRAAHRQVENQLRLSEERFRTLFGSIRDAVFVHGVGSDGRPGCFVEVNDVACRRLGYSREELLALGPFDIDAADSGVDVGPIIEQLAAGHNVLFEQVHVAKDGKRIPVEVGVSKFLLHGEILHLAVVRDITVQKAAERDLLASREQLREMAAYELSLREAERKRIARELHDELGQMLTGIKMDLSLLRTSVAASPALAERLQATNGLVDATLASVRRISADLRPMMLDELGLKAALEWMTEEFEKRYRGISCRLAFDIEDYSPDDAMSIAAYRIVQEGLTNVARHAQAANVAVAVALRDWEWIVITVHDDGRGLPLPAAAGGFGLLGMRERVNALHGSFHLDSRPGAGVTLEVALPLFDPASVGGSGQ